MRKHLFTISIFTIIGISIGILKFNLSEINIFKDINNNIYSKKSINLKIKNTKSNSSLKEIDSIDDNFTIYSRVKNINYVYFKGKGYIPPVYEGSFFSDNDFINSNNFVVVGKNIKADKVDNGDEYIYIEDKLFKIIGRVGIEEKTILDDSVYLPLNEESSIEDGDYTINYNSNNDILRNLRNKIGSNYAIEQNYNYNRIFNFSELNKNYYFSIILMYILSLISISYYQVINKKDELLALSICGIGGKNVYIYCLKKNIMLAFFSLILGNLFSLILAFTLCNEYVFSRYIFNFYFISEFIIYIFLIYVLLLYIFLKNLIKREKRGLNNDY